MHNPDREVSTTPDLDSILREYFLTPRYIPIALKRLLHRYGWQEFKVIFRSSIMFARYFIGKK